MIRGLLLVGLIGSAAAASGAVPALSDATLLPTAILCVFLLIGSAFFSSAETALFSLQPVDIEAMSGKGEQRTRQLLAEPRQTLASILIGNETVNIALSTVSAGLLLRLFPEEPWLNIVIIAPILLIFGEVLPKTFAFRFARNLAPYSATFLTGFYRLVTPIRFVLSRLADAALVLTGGSRAPRQAALREAHLRAMIDQGREEGNIRAMEQEILHRVFEFGGLTVAKLMTPNPEVFSVNLLTPWDALLDTLRLAGHSRVPVWQGTPNNIVGILVVKRLLPLVAAQRMSARSRSPSPRQIHKLLHPPRFVPGTKMADEMLAEFQARRSHMAIVVNEHGHAVGVVTLDDLLEELVGEMFDETDAEDPAVTPIEVHNWAVRGDMVIEDFAERFHVLIPPGTYTDLAGLVAGLSKTPLSLGQSVEWNGIRFHVDALDNGVLTQARVDLGQAYAQDDPTGELDSVAEEAP
jgi:putative hemolysin